MSKNPTMLQTARATTTVLLSLFLLSGCGDSGVQQISGAPASASAASVNPRILTGIWGGYFPGSSIQKPDHGVEFHFDVPMRSDGSLLSGGFVHRPNHQGSRHDLTVERQGDQVTVTLGKGTPDEGVFRGQFVDSLTIQGTYTNVARGESHPIKLMESRTPELRELRPAARSEVGVGVSPLAVDLSKPVTLQLDFTTTYESYSFRHLVNFGFGPYHYVWSEDFGTARVVGWDKFCWVDLARVPWDYDHGVSTVASMTFYPDWLLLECWDPDEAISPTQIFSLELPWDSLLTLDGSKLASGSEATEKIPDPRYKAFSEYCEVSQLRMSYIPSPSTDLDASIFRYESGIPPFRNVVVGGNVYQVPCNTIKLLEYLDFVIPFQQ